MMKSSGIPKYDLERSDFLLERLKLGDEVLKALEERKLPPFLPDEPYDLDEVRAKHKRQIIEVEYGEFPEEIMKVEGRITSSEAVFGGKAAFTRADLTLKGEKCEFTFPISYIMPNDGGKKHPTFFNIAFGDMPPESDIPLEYMMERGFAIFSFHYKDVTADTDDFSDGLMGCFSGKDAELIGEHKISKMAIWGYATSRMLDYALTVDGVDSDNTIITGHSRLGKTALFTGIIDERFKFVIVNDSGCCGAALHRGKSGEKIVNITTKYLRWFTKDFAEYQDREDELPFDQHTVMGLVAPRYMYVASGVDDLWSDPPSEFLGAAAASQGYLPYGLSGLVADKLPKAGDYFHEGHVGYHVREGGHTLVYEDWKRFMDYVDLHK